MSRDPSTLTGRELAVLIARSLDVIERAVAPEGELNLQGRLDNLQYRLDDLEARQTKTELRILRLEERYTRHNHGIGKGDA